MRPFTLRVRQRQQQQPWGLVVLKRAQATQSPIIKPAEITAGYRNGRVPTFQRLVSRVRIDIFGSKLLRNIVWLGDAHPLGVLQPLKAGNALFASEVED